MMPGQVFNKPCLIALRRLSVVGLKIDVLLYCASSGLGFWSRIIFVTSSDCYVYRGSYHVPVCLFLVPFIIPCQVLWIAISCLYSVMVHSSSHKTPNDIIAATFIFGK